LELLIIVPVLLAFVLLLVAVGRVSQAGHQIDAAAASAARAASQQYDAAAAQAAAADQARQSMSQAGVRCGELVVDVDTSAFAAPAGTTGSVTVQLSCTVSLSDVAAPGIPGSKTLTGRAASPVDLFREARDRP